MAPKKGKGKKKQAQQRKKAPPGGGGGGPSSAAAPSLAMPRGQLAGLRSRPDLNGRRVEVEAEVGKDGAPRLKVRLLFGAKAGTVLKVKAANLKLDTDRGTVPALNTLVEAMQALAPGATPAEEQRDWAGLPQLLLVKVAEVLVARNEAGWVAWCRENSGVSEEQIQEAIPHRRSNGNCLFVMAMVCKDWRKAQLKVRGRLYTRTSDVLLPGQVELMKWALAEGCPRDHAHQGVHTTLASIAAGFGHMELVRWLIQEQGFAMDGNMMRTAARGGNLELVQWLRAKGCEWNAACAEAASRGHLKVLQWLRANGCPWNAETCASAAEGNQLKTLQWLRANGCPWNKWTCFQALKHGHVEVLRWARANGCPWNRPTQEDAAEKLGYTDNFGNLVDFFDNPIQ